MRIIYTFSLCLFLSACAAPGLDADKAARYHSIEQLVEAEIGETESVYFNSVNLNQIAKPFNYSHDYCVHNGGSFVKVESAPRIDHFYISQMHDDRLHELTKLNNLFGLFECRSEGRVNWAINIQHNDVETSFQKKVSNTIMQVTPFSADAYARRQDARNTEVAAAKNRQLGIEMAFVAAATADKAVGKEVCSRDNRFGYIERIAGDRIQIRVVGQISDRPDYYFYNDPRSSYWKKIDRIIWDSSDKWGGCAFSH